MYSAASRLNNILESLLNLIYPAKCIACAKVLPHGVSLHVCEPCFPKLEFINEKTRGNFHFDYNTSFFEYNDTLRRIILDIKFGKKAHKMVSLANIAVNADGSLATKYIDFDAVVPVPLHANRLKERGFNQAHVLAKVIAKAANLPLDDNICMRTVDTMPQSMMHSSHRHDNVHDVFKIRDGADVSGKNFVLVDDVFTSGETLNSLAAAFKDDGAEAIVCITACMAYTKTTDLTM